MKNHSLSPVATTTAIIALSAFAAIPAKSAEPIIHYKSGIQGHKASEFTGLSASRTIKTNSIFSHKASNSSKFLRFPTPTRRSNLSVVRSIRLLPSPSPVRSSSQIIRRN